jgi:uncharacterized membrane protein
MVNNQPLNNQTNDEQPLPNHPATQIQLWGSGVVVGLMLLMSLYAGAQLPAGAKIPVHWNALGEVDRYGGRFEGLFLLPLVAAGLALLFYFLPYLDPHGENIRRSGKAYRVLWMVMLLFFLVLHSIALLSVLGVPINMTQAILSAMGLMFMFLGNYMGKIRRNYLMGIRTPWTLHSDAVWDKTHRLGGKLFMLSGFLTLVAGLLLQPMWGFVVLGVSMGITLAVSLIYSYRLWRQETVG